LLSTNPRDGSPTPTEITRSEREPVRRMKANVAIPRFVLVVALAACGTACSAGGSGSVRTLPRLQTGADYVWVPTQAGIFPINVVRHIVSRPLKRNILEYYHLLEAFPPRAYTAYVVALNGCFSVNLTNGKVSKPIAHTRGWQGITVAPHGRTFYLTGKIGKESDDVLPVSTVTDSVEAPIRIPGGRGVATMAIAPSGNTAYVVTDNGNTFPAIAYITPLNLRTRAFGTPIVVTGGVDALAISPDGNMAYAISATQTGTAIATDFFPINLVSGVVEQPLVLGFESHGIIISSNGRTAYLTDGYGVRFVDLATGKLELTIHLPNGGGIFDAPS
jgi:DNA-binding beta-propeller fold protein YncE